MKEYGITKYLDISTAHITDDTLTTNSIYKVAGYPEGAFFWVDYDLDDGIVTGIPNDLIQVFRFAISKGCNLIRFDADGFEFPELPTYDW